MRGLDPEVVDAVSAAVEPFYRFELIVIRSDVIGPTCRIECVFEGMLIRLVVGCTWVDVERLMGNVVSDTTLRHRRDEWIRAGLFERLADEAVTGYDRVIGQRVFGGWQPTQGDRSVVKEPARAPSIEATRLEVVTCPRIVTASRSAGSRPGTNRNDCVLLAPTLATVAHAACSPNCETLHLDRGYDNGVVRAVAGLGIEDLVCSKVRRPGTSDHKKIVPLGLRWPIERTNSWPQTSDSSAATPTGAPCIASPNSLMPSRCCSAKLIDWRNRWNP